MAKEVINSIKELLEKHTNKIEKIDFGKIIVIVQDGKADRLETNESLK